MQFDLFPQELPEGVTLLRGFALPTQKELIASIRDIAALAPFRQMITPGGHTMSVAMTNCGQYGWVTDKSGYRFASLDPLLQRKWPAMPACFFELAVLAAAEAGFENFLPDSCLMNRYSPGAKLSLHQDKDELDYSAPVVSVSLGLPATFLLGGLSRSDKQLKITLEHGDVIIWGGPARLLYHGIQPLKKGIHDLLGEFRFNLTFRKAK